jgi:hypothetical protein
MSPKGGRPSKYTEELANELCDKIATSNRGLAHICAGMDIKPSAIFTWLQDKPEFAEKYARAREAQADFLADEILEIADNSENDTIITENGTLENKEWVNRSKLKVEARKWIASKLKPKKYGDKLDLTTGGDKLQPTIIDWTGTNGNNANSKTEGSS